VATAICTVLLSVLLHVLAPIHGLHGWLAAIIDVNATGYWLDV